ncbi:hypothetical protein WOLCODRAFT_127757 [Wolfiporia cocos MD-104 SS10]|uniref:Zn(2)-C6 fungal-type domain-containing protein n=1 Tax=Wolfiporia cocos (strain MD-104) TaxID=742152 RepID=A0A2H3J3N6_WOLCO|nr:hypothetical protein WOLCODRAFT_127757 [Wolfiporia cocos MD-104 SS10]
MPSMSEDEEHTGSENANRNESKRRRLKRTQACDGCRRKKIKCDGDQKPDHRCTHCTTYNSECTYSEPSDRSLTKRYVTGLESRIEKMEQLLGQMHQGASTLNIAGPSYPLTSPGSDILTYGTTTLERTPGTMYRHSIMREDSVSHLEASAHENLNSSDDEAPYGYSLVRSLRRLHLRPDSVRFYGKSSSATLLETAYRTKMGTGDKVHGGHQRPRFWAVHPWLMPELQREPPPYHPESFPDDGLMQTLIDLYFTNVDPYHPLLHRPTFERSISNRIHLHDEDFGSTVLLVCAVGARFSDDARVFLPGYEDDTLSRGWRWYKEVHIVNKPPFSLPRLYDLQKCCLTAQFMEVTYSPLESWKIVGYGIRLAQDVGAYHKKVYNREDRVEEELWKRAFWTLTMMDRYISTTLGRSCAMQDEDLDLDLLLECDDEYWTNSDPGLVFKQPQGKPSYIEYFNYLLRLSQILVGAQRTIYSSRKLRSMISVTGPEWEERLVAELDSALNRWIDSVPNHLRWNPDGEDNLFFNQAAQLYVAFYQTQIFVHRQFLQAPRKRSAQFSPSLAICTNAARCTVHILDLQFKRTGFRTFNDQISLFTSGIVLLLNIWSAKRSGATIDIAKEMADVHTCMNELGAGESRWHQSGRVWDVMYGLIYASNLPLPQTSRPSQKRAGDGDGKQRTPMTAPISATGHSPMSNFVGSNANSAAALSNTEPSGQRQLSYVASPAETLLASGLSGSMSSSKTKAGNFDATTAFTPGNQTKGVHSTASFPQMNSAVDSLTQPAYAFDEESVNPMLSSIFSASDSDVWGTFSQATPASDTAMQQNTPSADGSLKGATDLVGETQEIGSSGYDSLMAMWSSMPANFDWGDWEAYISNMDDFMGGGSSSGAG